MLLLFISIKINFNNFIKNGYIIKMSEEENIPDERTPLKESNSNS